MALMVHPPKQEGGGGGGGVSHHELLSGLLGGDAGGHYHLTREQWERVLKLIETPAPPEWTAYDGGYAGTAASEYEANRDKWLDGGYSPDDHAGGVNGGGAAG